MAIFIQNTIWEQGRIAEIDSQLAALENDKTALRNEHDRLINDPSARGRLIQIDAELRVIQEQATALNWERRDLATAPLNRDYAEKARQTELFKQNIMEKDRQEQVAKMPAPPPVHPVKQWLDRHARRANELEQRSHGGLYPLPDQDRRWLIEYNQTLKAWNRGEIKEQTEKQATTEAVKEMNAARAEWDREYEYQQQQRREILARLQGEG